MARPSTFTPEIAQAICQRLAAGESLRAICRDEKFPDRSTVAKWVIDDVGGFSVQYTRARDIGLDAMAEELIDIADSPMEGQRIEEGPDGKKVVREDMLGHRRLQVDTRKWILCKLAPKKYGDRVQQEISGTLKLEDLIVGGTTGGEK